MKNYVKLFLGATFIFSALILGGCGGSGGSSTTYYRSYNDPYPGWGRRDVVVYDVHRRPRPPGARPPGMGRPPGGRPPGVRPPARPRPMPRRR